MTFICAVGNGAGFTGSNHVRHDERGWRATFTEHAPTSASGTAWERTPWHTTQRAAWEVLRSSDP